VVQEGGIPMTILKVLAAILFAIWVLSPSGFAAEPVAQQITAAA